MPGTGIWEELEGSPRVELNRRGGTADRIFKLPWADILQFSQAYFPDPSEQNYETIGFPGLPWLLVESVQFEPFDPANPDPTNNTGQMNTYTAGGCKATVHYAVPKDDHKAGPADKNHTTGGDGPFGSGKGPGGKAGSTAGQKITFVTHRCTIGSYVITYPIPLKMRTGQKDAKGNDIIKFSGDFEDVPGTLVMPTIEHIVTWNYCANVPWDGIRNCVGKVNSAPYSAGDPETMLFLGCEADHQYGGDAIANESWKLQYKFSQLLGNTGVIAAIGDVGRNAGNVQPGWNTIPVTDRKTGVTKWEHQSTPKYQSADFAALFTPPSN